jgi:hypothetical protein
MNIPHGTSENDSQIREDRLIKNANLGLESLLMEDR